MFGKKAVQIVQAKIIADEGHKWVSNSTTSSSQREKYIVEVYPESEPTFRTEVEAWVNWGKPEVGDAIQVEYTPGSNKVKLCIKGDPRFDKTLGKAAQKAEDAAARDELLNGPVSPSTTSASTQVCASCQFGNPEGIAFCSKCGAKLSRP